MTYPPGPEQQPWQPYGAPGYYQPPDHPRATTAMVLGILGVTLCGVCGPFAWVIGRRAVAEIDASGGQLGGRGQAQAGYVMGIIATILLGLGLLLVLGYLTLIVSIFGAGVASSA